ncbi:MAG: hypothetical protein IPG98_15130 [Burkholderiales bacterium]|nr:hypothetical protein [Burkholderiales bacterium]MBK8667072.1 hypothetical protein [Burkholderiales bacterium]
MTTTTTDTTQPRQPGYAPHTLQLASGEPLFERTLTYRMSTLDALAVFMADHWHATGQTLTKAAAIDWLLRRQLGRYGPAVREALHPPTFDLV